MPTDKNLICASNRARVVVFVVVAVAFVVGGGDVVAAGFGSNVVVAPFFAVVAVAPLLPLLLLRRCCCCFRCRCNLCCRCRADLTTLANRAREKSLFRWQRLPLHAWPVETVVKPRTGLGECTVAMPVVAPVSVGLNGDGAAYGNDSRQKVTGLFVTIILGKALTPVGSSFLTCAFRHMISFGNKTLWPLMHGCSKL